MDKKKPEERTFLNNKGKKNLKRNTLQRIDKNCIMTIDNKEIKETLLIGSLVVHRIHHTIRY